MNLVQKSPDVFVAEGPIAAIGAEEIALLKSVVAKSPSGRVRINAHGDGEDRLHEMFIAIRPDSYIRPHKHPSKSESFHLVYGAVDIVVFEDDGRIRQIVSLAAGNPAKPFYYRMSKPFFHTLVVRSDMVVVHEITNGPLQQGGSVFASFAPEESDAAGIAVYKAALAEKIRRMGGI